MGALCVVNDSFHIENDRYVGAGVAFRNVLRMELSWAVNNKLLFLQLVMLSFHICIQGSPIYIGELEVIVLFPFKMVAGIADGIIISQDLTDPDTGKNPLKHIGRA